MNQSRFGRFSKKELEISNCRLKYRGINYRLCIKEVEMVLFKTKVLSGHDQSAKEAPFRRD